jgi:hypothetical protein
MLTYLAHNKVAVSDDLPLFWFCSFLLPHLSLGRGFAFFLRRLFLTSFSPLDHNLFLLLLLLLFLLLLFWLLKATIRAEIG